MSPFSRGLLDKSAWKSSFEPKPGNALNPKFSRGFLGDKIFLLKHLIYKTLYLQGVQAEQVLAQTKIFMRFYPAILWKMGIHHLLLC